MVAKAAPAMARAVLVTAMEVAARAVGAVDTAGRALAVIAGGTTAGS